MGDLADNYSAQLQLVSGKHTHRRNPSTKSKPLQTWQSFPSGLSFSLRNSFDFGAMEFFRRAKPQSRKARSPSRPALRFELRSGLCPPSSRPSRPPPQTQRLATVPRTKGGGLGSLIQAFLGSCATFQVRPATSCWVHLMDP